MKKKFIAHILLLPYYAVTGLFVIIFAWCEAGTGRGSGGSESIYKSIKSRGLFVFTQLLVVAGAISSGKGVVILGGISFLAVSSLGKYLLWKNGSSAFQSANSSDYQSQSYDYAPKNLQPSNNLYEQQELESQKRKEDDYQRRRQQEYYEQQQRENQKRHEEQIRQAEESRRKSREEEQRRDEENRKNWGRF